MTYNNIISISLKSQCLAIKSIGPFEWLFSSSTFFTFCYILLDWLFEFFLRDETDLKIHRQICVEWPLTSDLFDEKTSATKTATRMGLSFESCSDVLLFSRDDISLEFLWSFSSWPAGKVNLKCHMPGIHQKNSPVHKNIHVHYPSTLVQQCTNVIQMFCVCWVAEFGYWCLSTSILASSSSRLSIWAATKNTHIKVSWGGGSHFVLISPWMIQPIRWLICNDLPKMKLTAIN